MGNHMRCKTQSDGAVRLGGITGFAHGARMMQEFLAPYGLSFADVFAGLALLLSLAAIWVAVRGSDHARRQADGAIGELPPNLSLHPVQRLGSGGHQELDDLILRVDNHNRRPVRVTGLKLEKPAKMGFVAYLVEGTRETLLAAGERKHDEIVASVTVPGTPPGTSQFNSANIKIVLSGESPPATKKKAPVRVGFRVTFEILQPTPQTHTELVQVDVAPKAVLGRAR